MEVCGAGACMRRYDRVFRSEDEGYMRYGHDTLRLVKAIPQGLS